MANQLQAQVYSENWWTSAASNTSTLHSTSLTHDLGGFGRSKEAEMKKRSYEDAVSIFCNSMVYQNSLRPRESDSIAGESEDLMDDSTLQMMVYSLLSPTTDCSQGLVRCSGRSSELNLSALLQDDSSPKSILLPESGLDCSHTEKVWTSESFSDEGKDPSVAPVKYSNRAFLFEQDSLDSSKKSDNCRVNYEDMSMNYPTASAASIFLPELYGSDPPFQQPPYSYSSPMEYNMEMNEISSKQQSNATLNFCNNTPFLNASEVRSNTDISPQAPYLRENTKDNPSFNNLAKKMRNEEVCESSSVIAKSSETTFKRPRIETPSSFPTFKVRKEKLGDRVTALQQLVSPFGKTDTASVLFEAIEYIKFLHDQVGVLSTPYMKSSIQHQQNSDQPNNIKAVKQDLRSRGLCLVPVSNTFAVTNEITTEFWTPTFGGSYK